MEYAFETTGVPEVLTQAVRSLDSLGTCAYVGTAPPGVTGGIPMLEAMTKGLTVRGVLQGDSTPARTIPRLWDLHRRGLLPVRPADHALPARRDQPGRGRHRDRRRRQARPADAEPEPPCR